MSDSREALTIRAASVFERWPGSLTLLAIVIVYLGAYLVLPQRETVSVYDGGFQIEHRRTFRSLHIATLYQPVRKLEEAIRREPVVFIVDERGHRDY